MAGRIALITGAASGIGKAGAELFAERGVKVIAVDKNGDSLAAAVEAMRAAGGEVTAVPADLGDTAVAAGLVARVLDIYGGLDILWNNAGITGPVELEETEVEALSAALTVNVTAGILLSRGAVDAMRASGTKGAILFTSSTSGLVGSPKYSIYSASKHALIGYTKSLAQRVAADGIRVNAICPGQVNTPMIQNLLAGPDGAKHAAAMASAIPLGRPAEPIEIAHAAWWLAGPESSFVTGIALPIDGGFIAK